MEIYSCSPGIDEIELAIDSLDALGLIVADEIAETMGNCGADKGERL